MLKLAGETEARREKLEHIAYSPAVQDTSDLEAGTHTIVPTSRPAIGSAQYTKSLTLPKPSDARLVVKRIASRLNVNIAGLGTATTINCSVRVDVDDDDHELFNHTMESVGSKLAIQDVHAALKATIFNLLKDGAAHTFYFLFWADVANQATIDIVRLWEGVGSTDSASEGEEVLTVSHSGLFLPMFDLRKIGTGSFALRIMSPTGNFSYTSCVYVFALAADQSDVRTGLLMSKVGFALRFAYQSVATDLIYVNAVGFLVRSE